MAPLTEQKIAEAIRGGTIPEEFLLGYGVISTVPDVPVRLDQLHATWSKNNLDGSLIPSKRELVHVFQAACRSVESRRGASDDERIEIKVDEIMETADECCYQITRLVRDRANRLIDLPKAMRVTFSKNVAGDPISVDRLDRQQYEVLSDLESQIRDYYHDNSGKVPGKKIRGAFRTIIKDLGGVNARGSRAGGFYFVPVEGKKVLDSLREVLVDLFGEGASMMTLPIVDGEYERKEISKSYSDTTTAELDEMLTEVVNHNRKGTIREDRLNNIIHRRRLLAQGCEKYEEILRTKIDTVREKISILDEGLDKLVKAKYSEEGKDGS